MISCSEKQLMQLVVAGAADEQIASCLDLSTKEVQLRIDHLMKRLGLTERIELIFYACSEVIHVRQGDSPPRSARYQPSS
jgi:DNA-binding NarL/FixJ family response regulator